MVLESGVFIEEGLAVLHEVGGVGVGALAMWSHLWSSWVVWCQGLHWPWEVLSHGPKGTEFL